jgi:hypothetical protein
VVPALADIFYGLRRTLGIPGRRGVAGVPLSFPQTMSSSDKNVYKSSCQRLSKKRSAAGAFLGTTLMPLTFFRNFFLRSHRVARQLDVAFDQTCLTAKEDFQ